MAFSLLHVVAERAFELLERLEARNCVMCWLHAAIVIHAAIFIHVVERRAVVRHLLGQKPCGPRRAVGVWCGTIATRFAGCPDGANRLDCER